MENQFRLHFRPSFLDKINTLYYRLKGVRIGSNSYIQWRAKLERFPKNISIGNNTIIKPYTRICACNKNSSIKIADNVSIGHFSFIYSSLEISIGDRCMVAPFSYLVDSNHDVKKGVKPFETNNICEPIVIKDDCWIGQNSTILAGSIMNNESVLGAKSLLRCEVKEKEIFAGIPAKLITERK